MSISHSQREHSQSTWLVAFLHRWIPWRPLTLAWIAAQRWHRMEPHPPRELLQPRRSGDRCRQSPSPQDRVKNSPSWSCFFDKDPNGITQEDRVIGQWSRCVSPGACSCRYSNLLLSRIRCLRQNRPIHIPVFYHHQSDRAFSLLEFDLGARLCWPRGAQFLGGLRDPRLLSSGWGIFHEEVPSCVWRFIRFNKTVDTRKWTTRGSTLRCAKSCVAASEAVTTYPYLTAICSESLMTRSPYSSPPILPPSFSAWWQRSTRHLSLVVAIS